jgi:outer membrane biosynthesis protein TonB
MPGRLGPRFAIEALFLIALAVGVAYADLSRKWIAIVMAGGWLVVALLELTAERIWATAPPWRRPDYYAAPAPRREPIAAPPATVEAQPNVLPEAEPASVAAAELEPEPEPEAATVIERPSEPAVPEPEPEPEPEPAPIPTSRPKLEPLEAKPKRRWFRREHEEVPDETTEIPMPKHVRLLSPTEHREGDTDEIAGLFDEENTSA